MRNSQTHTYIFKNPTDTLNATYPKWNSLSSFPNKLTFLSGSPKLSNGLAHSDSCRHNLGSHPDSSSFLAIRCSVPVPSDIQKSSLNLSLSFLNILVLSVSLLFLKQCSCFGSHCYFLYYCNACLPWVLLPLYGQSSTYNVKRLRYKMITFKAVWLKNTLRRWSILLCIVDM